MTDKEIRIEIKATSKEAQAAIEKLTNKITQMDKKLQRSSETSKKGFDTTSRSITSLAAHLIKLQALYGAFHTLQGAINKTADFDKTLLKVGITAGATSDELDILKDKALDMGAKTEFSAIQALGGLQSLAQQGLTTSEMVAGINPVLNLAAFGMIEIGEAARFASTLMKEWNVDATELGDITDLLAKGSTLAATSLDDYARAFIRVSPVAKNYGFTMLETAAALDVMADAGRRNAEAGTQLKMVMDRLAGNPEALKYMKDYGINLRNDNDELYSFAEMLKITKEKLDELAPSQRAVAETRIFGTEAKASAISLMENTEKMIALMGKLKTAMDEDFAEEGATKLMDTLRGSIDRLKAAGEGLALRFGENLTPAIRSTVDAVSDFINNLSDSEIKVFTDGIKTAVGVFKSLFNAATTLISPIVSLIAKFPTLTSLIAAAALSTKVFSAALKMNPIVRGLTAGLAVLSWGFSMLGDAVDDSSKKINESQSQLDKAAGKYAKLSKDMEKYYNTETGLLEMSKSEREAATKAIERQILTLDSNINKISKEAETNSDLSLTLQSMIAIRGELEKKLKDTSSAMIVEGSIAERTAKAYKQSIKEIEQLNKTIDKLENKYTSLSNSALKSLNKLSGKENQIQSQLKTLYANRLKIIQNYNNKLQNLDTDYYESVRSTISAIQSVEQKAANERLSIYRTENIAKKALLDNNLGQAINYYKKVGEMTSQLTIDSIASDGKIIGSNKRLVAEKLRLLKISHDGQIKAIRLERIAELEKNKAAIEQKKVELELVRLQIKLTNEYINTIKKLQETLTNTKMEIDITSAKEALKTIDDMSKKLDVRLSNIDMDINIERAKSKVIEVSDIVESSNPELNLDMNIDEAKSETTTFFEDMEKNNPEPDLELDVTPAYNDYYDFKDDVEDDEPHISVRADASGAYETTDEVVGYIDTSEGKIIITADTQDAITKYNDLINKLQSLRDAELSDIKQYENEKEKIEDDYFDKITQINQKIYTLEEKESRRREKLSHTLSMARMAIGEKDYQSAKSYYKKVYSLVDQLKIGSIDANGEILDSEEKLAAAKARIAKEAHDGLMLTLNTEREEKRKAHEEAIKQNEAELKSLERLIDGIKELAANIDRLVKITNQSVNATSNATQKNREYNRNLPKVGTSTMTGSSGTTIDWGNGAGHPNTFGYANSFDNYFDGLMRNGFRYSRSYFAEGGFVGTGAVPGHDSSDSDSVAASVPEGSFVVRRAAVDKYGHNFLNNLPVQLTAGENVIPPHVVKHIGLPTLHKINNMKFAQGGLVGSVTTDSITQCINDNLQRSLKPSSNVTVNFKGKSFTMNADEGVARSFAAYVKMSGGV